MEASKLLEIMVSTVGDKSEVEKKWQEKEGGSTQTESAQMPTRGL